MRISACWIVKNEAANIAASIMSVKNSVEEMIVVDTGSTDDTVQIAEKYGARVEHFEWVEDFSAARNYCLSLASGKYVIFIDGDEYFKPSLTKSDQKVIHDFFEKTQAEVLQIPRIEIDVITGQIMGRAAYGRIMRRESIYYEHRIHEVPRKKDGEIPYSLLLDTYSLMHTGYSSDRKMEKFIRNTQLLEIEQPELTDEYSIFHNKAYLMREYLFQKDYKKAFENCRYLLDHYEKWGDMCRTYSGYMQRFYTAIDLAVIKRSQISRKEVLKKLIQAMKANYPNTRETVLIDLYYQMYFDYREDRFLHDLSIAESLTEYMSPSSLPEGNRAEGMIYGRGAMAAYYRRDHERAKRWAHIALQRAPGFQTEKMQAIKDMKQITGDYPEIRGHILHGDYLYAYHMILSYLDKGSLDHALMDFLLIVSEKVTGELAVAVRNRYETGMSMIAEAIELNDMINTGYADEDEVCTQKKEIKEITLSLFTEGIERDRDRPVTPEIMTLHEIAAPAYECKGLPVSAMYSYRLLLAKGVEHINYEVLILLFRKNENERLADQIEDLMRTEQI